MNGIQKVIKYCAMAFAIFLSVFILGSIVMAVASVSKGFLGIEGISVSDKERINLSEQYSVEEATDLGIEKVLVDCNAEIVIEQGETLSIEASNVTEDYEIRCDGNTLKIVQDRAEFNIHWFWFDAVDEQEKVVITIPSELAFQQIKVVSGSGAVLVTEVEADTVVLDSGSGRVLLNEVKANDLFVDSGSGKVTVTQVSASGSELVTGSGSVTIEDSDLGELVLDTGSGAVSMKDIVARDAKVDTGSGAVAFVGTLTGTCEFETGSGALAISLYGEEEEYRVDAECGSGTFRINGKKMEDGSYGNNRKGELIIDSGSGSVSVEFCTPEQE